MAAGAKNHSMLLTQKDLAGLLEEDDVVVVDCRFDLMNPPQGRAAWAAGHIPGAHYASLDEDLAAPATPDSGRHPLPEAGTFSALLSLWGVGEDTLVVAYDASGGAIAARLWWLMRWAGHSRAALLDGGFPAWEAAGLPVNQSEPRAGHGQFRFETGQMPTLEVADIQEKLTRGTLTLMDARDPVRFAGGHEPIDPVAGHVPGALNRPFNLNLDEHGCFRDPQGLREEFESLLAGRPAAIASMCGSGVTACHNLFAMELAGLPAAALYVGSWSGWITDPARPVAQDN
jgi:thiosulfate/3-mercaptopyruvate sulfurtransferase